ncbi:hypothetical protein Tco_0370046 [Tanacetum coccineum]
MECGNCKRVGHMTRDYRTLVPATTQGTPVANQKASVTYLKYGKQGHYKSDCRKLENQFHVNQIWKDDSVGYTSIPLLSDIIPTASDLKYNIELANGKIIGTDSIIQGCTLNFLNHPFNIDSMPIELGSFNGIVSMDWLLNYRAVNVCNKKLVRIPLGDETLTIQGNRNDGSSEPRLNIISCTKT